MVDLPPTPQAAPKPLPERNAPQMKTAKIDTRVAKTRYLPALIFEQHEHRAPLKHWMCFSPVRIALPVQIQRETEGCPSRRQLPHDSRARHNDVVTNPLIFAPLVMQEGLGLLPELPYLPRPFAVDANEDVTHPYQHQRVEEEDKEEISVERCHVRSWSRSFIYGFARTSGEQCVWYGAMWQFLPSEDPWAESRSVTSLLNESQFHFSANTKTYPQVFYVKSEGVLRGIFGP